VTDENSARNSADEAARGDEALAAARHLLSGGFHRDAVSRAYYAAYHWARALLLSQGVDPRTHRGVVQMLNLRFVKDGPMPEEIAAHLAHLETYRELSDYSALASFTQAQAEEEVQRAATFAAACRRLLSL
jgi:uncharacterized protein (UPF0332 family)